MPNCRTAQVGVGATSSAVATRMVAGDTQARNAPLPCPPSMFQGSGYAQPVRKGWRLFEHHDDDGVILCHRGSNRLLFAQLPEAVGGRGSVFMIGSHEGAYTHMRLRGRTSCTPWEGPPPNPPPSPQTPYRRAMLLPMLPTTHACADAAACCRQVHSSANA